MTIFGWRLPRLRSFIASENFGLDGLNTLLDLHIKVIKNVSTAVCKPPMQVPNSNRKKLVCTDNNKLSQRLRIENEIVQFLSKKSGKCLDRKILNVVK